jgi:hypothetical protein
MSQWSNRSAPFGKVCTSRMNRTRDLRHSRRKSRLRSDSGDDWLHEPKWDGYRRQIIKDESAMANAIWPVPSGLAAGIARRDLSLVLRFATYEAVFRTLYALGEPGPDQNEDVSTLYEDLLMADPSGKAGRPGSEDAALK